MPPQEGEGLAEGEVVLHQHDPHDPSSALMTAFRKAQADESVMISLRSLASPNVLEGEFCELRLNGVLIRL